MTSISKIRIAKLPDNSDNSDNSDNNGITPEHFGVFDFTRPQALPDSSVLLRNVCFGVNVGMRGRIGPAPKSAECGPPNPSHRYARRLGVGDVPQSDAGAQVLESRAADFKPGDWVVHTAVGEPAKW